MEKILRLSALVVVALFLGGCPAVTLDRLQDDFNALYVRKQALEAGGETMVLMPDSIRASFGDISTKAGENGAKVADTNPRLQIGYLVVEALAAWQAGDEVQDRLATIRKKHKRLCTDENTKKSPRDCLLATVSWELASQDQSWREFVAKREELKAMKSPYPADTKPKLYRWFKDFFERFASLKRLRELNRKSADVPEGFWKQYDKQLQIVFCNAREVPIYFHRAAGDVLDPGTQNPLTRTELWQQIKDLATKSWSEPPGSIDAPGPYKVEEFFAEPACTKLPLRLSYQSAS